MNPTEKFILKVISMTKEGGHYFYPNETEIYQIVGGKLHGTQRGVLVLSKNTSKEFSEQYLVVQK